MIESLPKRPGSLFVLDSYSLPMGWAREEAEMAIRSLCKPPWPHTTTIWLLHHSAANRDTCKQPRLNSSAGRGPQITS